MALTASRWAILNLGEQWDESNTPITPIASGYTKGSRSVVVGDADLMPEMERVHSHVVRYAGIEDLGVSDRSYRGDNNANVRIHACAYGWAKNIDSDMVSGRHVQVVRSFRCNVEGSAVHHAHCYSPGANAYGIAVERRLTSYGGSLPCT